MSDAHIVDVATTQGPARARIEAVDAPRAALVLGHGAGGGVDAPDLRAAADAARGRGIAVALVEQPYRVAGRRAPPRAPRLDAAWEEVLAALGAAELSGLPLIVGGRSSGARVACRTARATGAIGALCLAFPLQPPGRAGGEPRPSRRDELDGAGVPVLVVQGEGDPFGMPPPGPGRTVVRVAGDHSLRAGLAALPDAVGAWLDDIAPSR